MYAYSYIDKHMHQLCTCTHIQNNYITIDHAPCAQWMCIHMQLSISFTTKPTNYLENIFVISTQAHTSTCVVRKQSYPIGPINHAHTCMHVFVYVRMCIWFLACVHAWMPACICTTVSTRMIVCTCTYIYIYIHTYICIYTHIYI